MRLLLDTHIWIWSLTDPDRLTFDVRSELSDPKNELWLSAISVWEFLVLVRKGCLRLTCDVDRWLADALGRAPVREAPITFAVALESQRLALDHRDPADRFIAATARLLEATLVTGDRRLIEANELKVLANQ